ncbi:MAG TPA: SDR family NAD(P)-dependent oxidoreductase [Burkholderiaceae bacterium]|nr:SDR family NAD(P)-dependent oxidoreductase [Burkholderiaceae bacterium]
MDLKLTGRVAFISGAGRGIGYAEAQALGAEGVRVAVNDIDACAAKDAVARLQAEGVDALAVPGDASQEADVQAAVARALAHFGQLDILVNNAGVGVKPAYSVEDMPADAWDMMVSTHMRSTFLCSRAVLPAMRAGGYGRIINTSSMNYTGGGRPGVAHYAAAKAGIAGFTRTLAKEAGPHGITANAIAPGYVETDLIAGFTDDMRERLRRQNPLARMCRPDEVAALVAFLASEQAAFINGALVCMDGGRRDFYWGE